jgi:hypothetical protein
VTDSRFREYSIVPNFGVPGSDVLRSEFAEKLVVVNSDVAVSDVPSSSFRSFAMMYRIPLYRSQRPRRPALNTYLLALSCR